MFSYVLLFGVMNAISGKNSTNSSSIALNSHSVAEVMNRTNTIKLHTSTVYANTTSLVKNSSQTFEPSTTLTSVILITSKVAATPQSSSKRISPTFTSTSVSKSTFPEQPSKTTTVITMTTHSISPSRLKTMTSNATVTPQSTSPTATSKPAFPEQPSKSSTVISEPAARQTSQTTKPTRTTSRNTARKEKIFFWRVKTGTLKYMFYGTFGVLLICIILLIVSCCCWRRQKARKKPQRKDTTLSNPYINSDRNNHHVVGFPSPLQLDTFVIKHESPYDMPDVIEQLPEDLEQLPDDLELSYVSVIDGNESDSQYAAVKGNGTANSIADEESRDGDSQMTPEYANSSAFDPYQELMPAANRGDEDHYTSLIKRDEANEDNEANV